MRTPSKTFASLLVLALSACSQEDLQKKSNNLQPLKDYTPLEIETMSVKIENYWPTPGKTFKDLFVSNFSTKNQDGKLLLSSSRDGLPDTLKESLNADYGFAYNRPQSRTPAFPSFSDLVLWLAGLKIPQQSLLFCSATQRASTSGDNITFTDPYFGTSTFLGLRDCEKNYMNLNPRFFDFDSDGIPDYLELRCGLNPNNRNDASNSPSGDGVPNIEKCKRNVPIDEDIASPSNKKLAYKYEIEMKTSGARDFTITNIPILNGGQDNLLAFFVTETDSAGNNSVLYSAYSLLRNGSANLELKFNYWVTPGAPSTYKSQEIVAP